MDVFTDQTLIVHNMLLHYVDLELQQEMFAVAEKINEKIFHFRNV